MRTLLTSWKEIAGYLGRSVRTIQRWEREFGLPVHRPHHKQSRVVIADKAEIDAWVLQRKHEISPEDSLAPVPLDSDVEILQEMGRRSPSSIVLAALTEFVEQNLSCHFAEISLIDNRLKRRFHAAGKKVPRALLESHDFQSLETGFGICGVAASTRAAVFSNPISGDDRWVNVRNIVLKHGIAACWAQPIVAGDNVVGVVAAYFKRKSAPTYEDLTLMELVASMAGLSLHMSGITEPIDRFQKNAAFMAVDHELRVSTINRETSRILDKPTREIVGQRLWDLCPNSDPILRAEYHKVQDQLLTVAFEFLCAVLGFRLTFIARPNSNGFEIIFKAAPPDAPDVFKSVRS